MKEGRANVDSVHIGVSLLRIPRSHRYHHGDLRRQLVRTAAELVAERGSGDISLREVARRAGVSHSAPYRHFADREALLAAVARATERDLARHLDRAVIEADRSVIPAIEAWATAYVDYARGHAALFRSTLDAGPTGGGTLLAGLAAALGRGGRTQASGGDTARALAGAVWAAVHGLALLATGGRLSDPDAEEILRCIVERMAAGPRPPD